MYHPGVQARWNRFSAWGMLFLILPVFAWQPNSGLAQSQTRTFPETGRTVQGRFLQYWEENGGLAQQGYPISDEMLERSDVDGKSYTVQYFERAVFESHPENQPPYDVLLSLVGVFEYRRKYPNGAPAQSISDPQGARLFAETNKRVGGIFLAYWNNNGGLAQQGLPISEEFTERSEIDGKEYRVQYFERAVFEHHPDNRPPYDVLLSQLGTTQYKRRYQSPTATPVPPTPIPPSTIPSASPTATAVSIYDCEGLPPIRWEEMRLSPRCVNFNTVFRVVGVNFHGDTYVQIYMKSPNGDEGALGRGFVKNDGETPSYGLVFREGTDQYGIWTITMVGETTGRTATGFVKLVPYGIPRP